MNSDNQERQIYFDQYKMYISGIEKISDRRESANKYYWTINTGIILTSGFFISLELKLYNLLIILLLVSILGSFLSYIFWLLIRSYRQMNTGKFAVVHKMEEQLPVALYKNEWIELGEGKDKSKYYPFSHIEGLIPLVFCGIYTLCSIAILHHLICHQSGRKLLSIFIRSVQFLLGTLGFNSPITTSRTCNTVCCIAFLQNK